MRHIKGEDRKQRNLLPDSLEDFVDAGHPVRVIDAYIDALPMNELGFDKAIPEETGRRPYDSARKLLDRHKKLLDRHDNFDE